jgi:hypothetical protein
MLPCYAALSVIKILNAELIGASLLRWYGSLIDIVSRILIDGLRMVKISGNMFFCYSNTACISIEAI